MSETQQPNHTEAAKSAMNDADKSFGDIPRWTNAWFYLAVAAIHAIFAVAEAINQMAARLPKSD